MTKNLTPAETIFALDNLTQQLEERIKKVEAYKDAIDAVKSRLSWYGFHPEKEDGEIDETQWVPYAGDEPKLAALFEVINTIANLAK